MEKEMAISNMKSELNRKEERCRNLEDEIGMFWFL